MMDPYEKPDEDLSDWYVVDELGGNRRWIGKVIGTHYEPNVIYRIPLLLDELILQPAFEFYPDKLAEVHPVPDTNPLYPEKTEIKALVLRGACLQFDSLLCLHANGLPPQRVRYAGLSACSNWSPKRREEMARALYKRIIEQQIDQPPPDNETQPEEKVH